MNKDLILEILNTIKNAIEYHPPYLFILIRLLNDKEEIKGNDLYLKSSVLLKKIDNYIKLIEENEVNNLNDFIMKIKYTENSSFLYKTYTPVSLKVSDYIYADLKLTELLGGI